MHIYSSPLPPPTRSDENPERMKNPSSPSTALPFPHEHHTHQAPTISQCASLMQERPGSRSHFPSCSFPPSPSVPISSLFASCPVRCCFKKKRANLVAPPTASHSESEQLRMKERAKEKDEEAYPPIPCAYAATAILLHHPHHLLHLLRSMHIRVRTHHPPTACEPMCPSSIGSLIRSQSIQVKKTYTKRRTAKFIITT